MTLVKSRSETDGRRDAILAVAAEVFLEDGFSAASMATIASRLGGSKGTLYNYFKSKEELFEAHVRRYCDRRQEELFAELAFGDIREALTRFGQRLLVFTLSDFGLRNFRVIVAEAERSPAIGRAIYEAGPASGVTRLAAFLHAEVAAGDLMMDDPVLAAHQFCALCQNRMLKARLCGVMAEPTSAEIEREVHDAVSTFMAAFSVRRSKRKGRDE